MSEFLGARISLISRSDIRYVGILHEINSDDSTVSLENVRSFGTEGRKGNPDDEVAPSDQLYEYIVFRGTDVKDLRIEEGPGAVKENKPPVMPNDPAIVGARPRQGKIAPSPPTQPGPGPGPGPGPLGAPGFGYFPPHMGGWGRGNVPGPNTFGGMSYPPPPQWFSLGQEFSPMGPGPWNNFAFPPAPGGPPGPMGQPNRQPFSPQPPNPNAQVPASRPTPIGSGSEMKLATPAQPVGTPPEQKHAAQPLPVQPAATSAPTPPVESKPTVAEVQATAASLAPTALPPAAAAPENQPSQSAPNGPAAKQAGPSHIMPAVPLPAALTAKAAQQLQAAAGKTSNDPPSVAALRDATQAAKAAVAVAMAKLEVPLNSNNNNNHNNNNHNNNQQQQAGSSAMDNLTRKVNEMRMSSARGGPNSRGSSRGRGNRPAKVEVPDADFDFASANAKFNKEDLVKEAIAGSPLREAPNGTSTAPEATSDETAAAGAEPAYNKSRSFFDNISSEAKDRIENHGHRPGGREWRGEEQRRNMETFGQGSVDGGWRGYRGRGRGRGGRGRGGYNPAWRGHRNREAQPVTDDGLARN